MARQTRADKDLEMWKAWKVDPTPENLEPLLDNFQGTIRKSVNKFSAAPVPPEAVAGAANLAVLRGLNTFDPNRGASLNTHLTWHLKKLRSFVGKHQNMGRIPEHRLSNITTFQSAHDELLEKSGIPPDALTLAETLGWSVAEVNRMQSELRPDLIASKSLEVDRLGDLDSAHEDEVLRYIYHELTPDQRTVYEYSLGVHGKPKLKAGQIAKTMGVSPAKVSRLRSQIDLKLRERGV